MEHFHYKVGVANMNVHVLRHLKKELAWDIDKQLQLISNIFVSCTTKKLENKVNLSLK